MWDAEGGTAPPAIELPRFRLGGEPVMCVAWNNLFHVAGVQHKVFQHRNKIRDKII